MTEILIESLFFTNLFVFIYNNLLIYLNKTFTPPSPMEFIRSGAVAEPYEITLYLSLSALTVLGVFLLHRYIKNNLQKYSTLPFLRYIILIFLLIPLKDNLGIYPMAHSIYPYPSPEDPLTYFIYLFGFLITAFFFIIETSLLNTLVKKNRLLLFLLFLSIVGMVALSTFEPRFPISGHDYSYFYGPVWEVLQGKTLYTEAASQYGFGSILFLALLIKVGLLNPWYLPVFVWLLYIVEYLLCFYIIKKVSGSMLLSLLGLVSIITLNYYSLYHLPASIPQVGPLRWLPLVLSLVLLFKFKNLGSKVYIFFIAASSFWVIDSGISLILAYLFTLFILTLSDFDFWTKAIKNTAWFFFSLLVIFLGINLIHLLFGYRFVNIFLLFAKFGQYAKAGFGMLPIDSYSYFWLVILIYFASIIYFFRNVFSPSNISHLTSNTLLLFSANLSLFASVYFVGRSHPHNLFNISIFPLLNAFLLIGLIYRKIPTSYFKLLTSIFLFLVFIVYPVYQRQEVMTKMIKTKIQAIKTGKIFQPEARDILTKKYSKDVNLINSKIADEKIVILSPDDTYLFYLSGKKNLLNDNSQITILTQKDIDTSLREVFARCPKKIAIDCKIAGSCSNSDPFTIAFFNIQPLLLDRIQAACKVKYKVDICSDHICIAKTD